jgi:hypothetical protein
MSGVKVALSPAAIAVTAKIPTAAPTQVQAIPIHAGKLFDWSIYQLRWLEPKRVTATQISGPAVEEIARHSNSSPEGSMTRNLGLRLFAGIIIASIWTASATSAGAQQTANPAKVPAKVESVRSDPAKKETTTANDSVSTADIERAAQQLAIAVQAAVKKATEDPAVKLAALKVATNAVNTAQVVITQQAATLQAMLDTLASELAMATDKQASKQKTH